MTRTSYNNNDNVRYGGWNINMEAGTATKTICGNIEENLILTSSGIEGTLQAWWPNQPPEMGSKPPTTIIGGCCLWDARWQIEFSPRCKQGSPGRKSLSFARDREEAFSRIRSGQTAQRIYVPRTLGAYHTKLLKWVSHYILKWSSAKVFYNLPVFEYHLYINELEAELGVSLYQLHQKLDTYARLVKELFLEHLGSAASRVQFISPITEWGAKSPVESFLFPYVFIRDLCEDSSRAVALEDLSENRLAREASQKVGFTIPVLHAVLGNSHPYRTKVLLEGEFDVLQLSM